MNFFRQAGVNPNATAETLVKERVIWNKGLSGVYKNGSRPKQSSLMKEYWEKVKRKEIAAPNHCFHNTHKNNAYRYFTPAGVYDSFGEALIANNVTRDQLAKRCKNKNFPDWYREATNIDYINKMQASMMSSKKYKQRKNNGAKSLMTPNGLFPSIQSVADAAKVDPKTVKRWINKWPEHYYYLEIAE